MMFQTPRRASLRDIGEAVGRRISWRLGRAARRLRHGHVPGPTAASPDLASAAATWNDPDESLDSVNARIHDGVALDKLRERADGYVQLMLGQFPYITLPGRPSCLEIGSGTGYIMEALNRALNLKGCPPASITGLDIAEHMLARARLRLGNKHPFRFLHYDGLTVPIADSSLDLVYSVAALQHVPKPYVYNLFFEIRRLLKPTGFAVLHLISFKHLPEQERHSPWRDEVRRQIGRDTGHWHHFYSRAELENVLQVGTGFGSVDIRENGSIWACVHQQALPTQGTKSAMIGARPQPASGNYAHD
jgi:ubiquinone/menaquinone biosynthesis C-methylase UbiE